MKRHFPLVIIAGVLVTIVAGALLLFRSKQAGTTAPFTTETRAIPAAVSPTARIPETLVTKSPTTNASVTVEEYGDYQCPPCGLLHPEIKKIVTEYGARVNFVFHNLPLTKIHKNALVAAQAAEAARLQDRFWQMHDLIYEKQNAWKDEENPRPTFTEYAREVGIDAKRFSRDIDGLEVQQHLDEDRRQAESLGVVGTPTIFIEGRQLKPEVTTGEGIRKGIDLMLARKAGRQ